MTAGLDPTVVLPVGHVEAYAACAGYQLVAEYGECVLLMRTPDDYVIVGPDMPNLIDDPSGDAADHWATEMGGRWMVEWTSIGDVLLTWLHREQRRC